MVVQKTVTMVTINYSFFIRIDQSGQFKTPIRTYRAPHQPLFVRPIRDRLRDSING